MNLLLEEAFDRCEENGLHVTSVQSFPKLQHDSFRTG